MPWLTLCFIEFAVMTKRADGERFTLEDAARVRERVSINRQIVNVIDIAPIIARYIKAIIAESKTRDIGTPG